MSFDEPFQPAMGNRATLTADELDILENKILPTARRWCEQKPGLRHHGEKTLQYWGEPVPLLRKNKYGERK